MTVENEKMDGQLYKMQKERKKIRKDLKIAWDTFSKKSDSKVQSTCPCAAVYVLRAHFTPTAVNKHYKEVQNQYREVELDLQDLQQFKV